MMPNVVGYEGRGGKEGDFVMITKNFYVDSL